MKSLRLLIFICTLLLTLGAAPQSEVILTASQVTSAVDIESAIQQATGNGAHAGTVTLDASGGDFVFTGTDRSVNIFLSNIRLRSRNGAVIRGCDDGVLFDERTANDVAIEGITFHCSTGGVVSGGIKHSRVSIRNNVFHAGAIGISVEKGSEWQVDNNTIEASEVGVKLGVSTQYARVKANTIKGVSSAGIALTSDNCGNHVQGNKVTCAEGVSCLVVDASAQMYLLNKITGNK